MHLKHTFGGKIGVLRGDMIKVLSVSKTFQAEKYYKFTSHLLGLGE